MKLPLGKYDDGLPKNMRSSTTIYLRYVKTFRYMMKTRESQTQDAFLILTARVKVRPKLSVFCNHYLCVK